MVGGMNGGDPDLVRLIAHLRETGLTSGRLPDWPGGYPGEVGSALIDAVFSIRARYGKGPGVGVRAVVGRWRAHRGVPADGLLVLAQTPVGVVRRVLHNDGRVAGRSKVEVVVDAAQRLSSVGLRRAGDFDGSSAQRAAYVGTGGCGPVMWSYLGMLLGRQDAKPDTWIMRYVRLATGGDVDAELARRLIHAALSARVS